VEWLKRLRECINYLEENMENKIEIDEVAKIALSSKFHFQRMFHMTTGVTVAEYVRKRRLTLAAQELATSDARVIDIAFKYGYQTPEAFSKAFLKLHGVNPSEVKSLGVNLKAYPPISFQIQIKGEKSMDYRIEEREAFKIIGKTKRVSTVDGSNFKIVPKFWDEINKSGVCEKLFEAAGGLGVLGVCMDYEHEKEEFTYMIAIEKPDKEMSGDFIEKDIPAATWAIFEAIGPIPDAIQDVWKRIYSEWFPATGYEHANAPELEVYLPGNPDDEDYKCEVWIPIIKK